MTFEFKKLGELCTKITDGSHYSPKEIVGGVPMYSVKDMTQFGFSDKSVKRISEEEYEALAKADCTPRLNDVLIAKDGSVLKHVFVVESEIKAALLSSIAILRPNLNYVDSEYLVYALQDPLLRNDVLSNYVSGSGVPRIILKDFKNISIKTPPLEIQKKISVILKSLDKRIQLNISISQSLEDIAQTIFKSWFIDFDPVKAKMAGEKPEGMDAATAALFPDSLEESELGLIPKGWEVAPIGNSLDVGGGTTPSTTNSTYWDGEHCWTTPKDLSGHIGIITTSSTRKITDSGLAQISSGLLPINSVLMSCRAPIGYVSINAVPTAVNQGFITMKHSAQFHPLYVLNWINANMHEIHNRAGGATFAEITRKAFRDIPFLKPANNVSRKYSELAEPILKELEQLTLQTENLQAIRDSLLPRLISGELQIPEEMLA